MSPRPCAFEDGSVDTPLPALTADPVMLGLKDGPMTEPVPVFEAITTVVPVALELATAPLRPIATDEVAKPARLVNGRKRALAPKYAVKLNGTLSQPRKMVRPLSKL